MDSFLKCAPWQACGSPRVFVKGEVIKSLLDLRATVLGELRNLEFKVQLQMVLEYKGHLLWAMHMWSQE